MGCMRFLVASMIASFADSPLRAYAEWFVQS